MRTPRQMIKEQIDTRTNDNEIVETAKRRTERWVRKKEPCV